jgi:hypothetical protein
MLIDTYKSLLKESVEDLIDKAQDRASPEDFNIDDIYEILDDLTQHELNQIGEFIMELVYDPEFDIEDLGESEDEELSLSERKYFGTRKREINRNKKKNIAKRKLDKKARKRYYKKNKAKIKRKQKLYRKKAKRQPNIVKKHRA